ncbi:MAG: molybdopterin molybdotransferase MoeA [Gallionella sp.]
MEYLKISAAQRLIFDTVQVLDSESVTLAHALGRVLSHPICANRDLPPYNISAMDGFAVQSGDLTEPPATLKIVEDIKAGDRPIVTLQARQCARIMTGAEMPQGADAVIRVEDTQETSDNCVHIARQVQSGNDVRLRGENMRDGEIVLTKNTEITPGVIGVLATVKAANVSVYRLPRVAILSTGNEIEAMQDPVDPYKIPDSNTYALMAQVQALGITPVLLGIAADDPIELKRYLERGLAYDVLLVSGGTSVGVHDYVRQTIESLGVIMKFWRVSMKPGHPLAFGVLHPASRTAETNAYVFGLPGNPVSSMVCFEEFVAPALRRMMGNPHLYRRTVTARLAHPIKRRAGRTEFIRVQLTQDETGYLARSTGTQSSGVLLSMARADGLLVAASDQGEMHAGEPVIVQLLDGTAFQNDLGFKE